MELILTDSAFYDVRRLWNCDIDIDLGDDKTFEVKIKRGSWNKDIDFGCAVYVPDTEYGGIIGQINTDTSLDTISIYGYTWRGILDNKIIIPPAGQDYYTVSGELNSIIRSLMSENFDVIFKGADEDTGAQIVSYNFQRYVTLYEGLTAMLKEYGHKLALKYNQITGGGGSVVVGAVPIVDYANEIELSQDSQLNFSFSNVQNGVNHLIALGTGELQARTVLHLYVDENGEIGNTKYYTGIKEIAQTFEVSSDDEIEANAREKLTELMSNQTFEMDVAPLELEVEIGDIIGGRDYLTGLYAKQPITNKIWRYVDGKESIEYEIKGDD